MTYKFPNPIRFRSIEEWEKFKNNEIGLSDLVQPFTIVGDYCVPNPEYEKLPFELNWVVHPDTINTFP